MQSKAIAFSSVVLFLALLLLRGHAMPLGWSTSSAISLPFAAHMAELYIRHTLASVSRVITIR